MRNKGFIFLLAYLFFCSKFLLAQLDITLDSKGTDFWLAFLPNYHNFYYSDNSTEKYGDSLFIFIAASEPTNGTIEYFSRKGDYYLTSFQMTNPDQMYVFKVSYWDFELLGYNESGRIDYRRRNQCELPSPNSFHITTDKEVTVYALNQAVTTSDAFMVLPTDVLGINYFVLSYKSDGDNDGFSWSTPSQFAVVATADSTIVTIIPKAETLVNGLATQKIILQQGQVYLVQAKITTKNLNPDLTGTQIVSTKPIAVFSGHQRATVPVPNNYFNPSRDVLIEQLPPVTT